MPEPELTSTTGAGIGPDGLLYQLFRGRGERERTFDALGVERPHAYEYDVCGGELLFRGFFGEGHPGRRTALRALGAG